jgi:hypothetical protein
MQKESYKTEKVIGAHGRWQEKYIDPTTMAAFSLRTAPMLVLNAVWAFAFLQKYASVSAFYLPGVLPRSYAEGDEYVLFFVSRIYSAFRHGLFHRSLIGVLSFLFVE